MLTKKKRYREISALFVQMDMAKQVVEPPLAQLFLLGSLDDSPTSQMAQRILLETITNCPHPTIYQAFEYDSKSISFFQENGFEVVQTQSTKFGFMKTLCRKPDVCFEEDLPAGLMDVRVSDSNLYVSGPVNVTHVYHCPH